MPLRERRDKAALHYRVDDFTDPWRKAPTIIPQHGFGRSSQFWYSWVLYLSRFCKVIWHDLRELGLLPADFAIETGITIYGYIKASSR
jgi:3-oxoadipate enol-lactonase